MQVVANTAWPVKTQNLAMAQAKRSPARGMIDYIAASTRLSRQEKQSYIRTLADIERYSNNDPKLIMKVMAAISMIESMRQYGEYTRMSHRQAETLYNEAVGQKTTESVSTSPTTVIA